MLKRLSSTPLQVKLCYFLDAHSLNQNFKVRIEVIHRFVIKEDSLLVYVHICVYERQMTFIGNGIFPLPDRSHDGTACRHSTETMHRPI